MARNQGVRKMTNWNKVVANMGRGMDPMSAYNRAERESVRSTASAWSVCAAPSRNAKAGAEPKTGGGGTVLGFFLWDA